MSRPGESAPPADAAASVARLVQDASRTWWQGAGNQGGAAWAGARAPRVAIVHADASVRQILRWIMETGLPLGDLEVLEVATPAEAVTLRFRRPGLDLLLVPTERRTRPLADAVAAIRRVEAAIGLRRVPILTRPMDGGPTEGRLPDVDQLLVDPMTDDEFLAVVWVTLRMGESAATG